MKVQFMAPVDAFGLKDTGYGSAAAGIAHCLKKMKDEKLIEDVRFVNIVKFKEQTPPKEKYDLSILVINPHSLMGPRSVLPKLEPFFKTSKDVFLSVVWETEPLPNAWKVLWESEIFTGFLTPSTFVGKQVLQVTDKPVFYYPHYIHTEEIPPVDIEQKVKEEDVFTALFIGQHTKRKGLEDAVIAFIRALGYETDARLVLKYHTLSPREMNPVNVIRHAVLCNTTQERPKATVYSITQMLERRELCRLYSASSMLLFPSYGEGFGLPPLEGMAANLPVVYTNWSSLPEVCEAPGNTPVGYVLDEAHSMRHHGYQLHSRYAIPIMADLMHAVRYHYASWKKDKKGYYEHAAGSREVAEKRFGYDAIKDCLLHIFSKGDGFYPPSLKDSKECLNELTSKK